MLQVSPMNPCAQSQLKVLTPSTHAPLFIQGFDLQSSMSNRLEYNYSKLIENIFFWCVNVYKYLSILLFSQFDPVNPTGQLHLYEATSSIHDPLLLQGFDLQSSISESNWDLVMKTSFPYNYRLIEYSYNFFMKIFQGICQPYLFHSQVQRNHVGICKYTRQYHHCMFHHYYKDYQYNRRYLKYDINKISQIYWSILWSLLNT